MSLKGLDFKTNWNSHNLWLTVDKGEDEIEEILILQAKSEIYEISLTKDAAE